MRALSIAMLKGAIAASLLASMAGCIRLDRHEGYEVILDVRSSQTGEPLSEWVVVSRMTSNVGWNTVRSDRTIEETVLLVMAQEPSHNRYQLESFADGGVIIIPPLGYGGWKMPYALVYAIGYEIEPAAVHREVIKETGDGDGGTGMQVRRLTYVLRPWNNEREHVRVRSILLQLSDTQNFEPYESLRGTAKGKGVPQLYEYYIRRFEAIRAANPDIGVDPAVQQSVRWLREGAVGTRHRPWFASPTFTRHTSLLPQPLTVETEAADRFDRFRFLGEDGAVRVAAVDAQTGVPLDTWVFETMTMALRRSRPYIQAELLLSLDAGTADSPDCCVPVLKAPKKDESDVLCRFSRKTVYAQGYEPSWLPAEDHRPSGLPHFTYRLRRWNNDDPGAVGALVKHLEDDRRFEQYEDAAKKGLSGVKPLYRYLLARYEALRPDQKDGLSPRARRRLEWLRERAGPGTGPDEP